MKRYRMLVIGIFLVLYALTLYIATFYMKTFSLAQIGPEFAPRLIAGTLLVLSVLLIVLEIRHLSVDCSKDGQEEALQMVPAFRRYSSFISLGLLFFYLVLLEPAGFILASTIYLFFQITVLYGRLVARKMILFLCISFGISSLIYVIFVEAFSLMLPSGLLG